MCVNVLPVCMQVTARYWCLQRPEEGTRFLPGIGRAISPASVFLGKNKTKTKTKPEDTTFILVTWDTPCFTKMHGMFMFTLMTCVFYKSRSLILLSRYKNQVGNVHNTLARRTDVGIGHANAWVWHMWFSWGYSVTKLIFMEKTDEPWVLLGQGK